MTRWTVTAKRVERVDALSQRLILVCERAGCIRFEAVVTGKTFDEKQVPAVPGSSFTPFRA